MNCMLTVHGGPLDGLEVEVEDMTDANYRFQYPSRVREGIIRVTTYCQRVLEAGEAMDWRYVVEKVKDYPEERAKRLLEKWEES